MRHAPLLLIVVAFAAGCGTNHARKSAATHILCTAASNGYRVCGMPTGVRFEPRPSIERLVNGDWQEVAGPVEHPAPNEWGGYWVSVAASPDGQTLLAQWSGECETQTAFFVSATGGRPRPVTGERILSNAPESAAVGWTRDGRARVKLFGAGCGAGASRPGIYLIDPKTGGRMFERPFGRPKIKVAPQIPTTLTALRGLPSEGVVVSPSWSTVKPPLVLVGLDGRTLQRISGFDVDSDSQVVPGSVVLRGHGGKYVLNAQTRRFVVYRRPQSKLISTGTRAIDVGSGESVVLPRDCAASAFRDGRWFLVCGETQRSKNHPATIKIIDRNGVRTLAGSPAHSYDNPLDDGFWRGLELSPDGTTLLAQWTAACEEPTAFFVDVSGGRMRPVTGKKDWRKAPESVALGWSKTGKAVVNLLPGGCGDGTTPPGIYLIEPATGKRVLVYRTDGWAVMWHP